MNQHSTTLNYMQISYAKKVHLHCPLGKALPPDQIRFKRDQQKESDSECRTRHPHLVKTLYSFLRSRLKTVNTHVRPLV